MTSLTVNSSSSSNYNYKSMNSEQNFLSVCRGKLNLEKEGGGYYLAALYA